MSFIKKALYFFVKRNSEKAHRAYYINKNNLYIKKYNECTQKKNPPQIKREMDALGRYWKVYPLQYYRYKMYRRDCTLTLDQMKDYIPDFFAYYLLYPKSFKERNVLCEDKMLFYSICKGLKIPQPKILFSIKNGQILSEELDVLNLQQGYEMIRNTTAQKIFCKPTFGVGGANIHVFNKQDNHYINKQDHTILDTEFLKKLSGQEYILQEGLVQHPMMNQIYPSAINTFRIVTESNGGPDIKIKFVLLRMGRGGMEIDNASSGGLYLKIDPRTGILNKFAVTNEQEEYPAHPDTNFTFEGYKVPVWDEITAFVKKAAFKFGEIQYIGWDIAYTINGPVVIEANNGPDISILQDFYKGVRVQFGIKSPKDFWYSDNYSLKDL